ncbi:hypothetical protein DVH26_04640 [Paenibacillus sp. H1-7]|uniref:hypothetical protein n=1 Tax=Paenibacillus sp. H1-7 TaxID=2282849 RepID=UPI001EF8B70C|nr:hypothetical protein [Paenibacillus sp. H1-7]ULL13794.1 hypothetical protein DVH26_04640 [Paenibacillus sp. H1-7]
MIHTIDQLQHKPRFRASINLQFDLTDEHLLTQYVLSPQHSDVLRGIVQSEISGGTRAHLLIGPYGTGKSFLATIVSQLLTRAFSSSWRSELQLQADHIDTVLATQLREFEAIERTYVPVIINGNTGELRAIINRSIYRKLKQENIEMTTPNEVMMILKTVQRWEAAYPAAFEGLQKHIESLGLTIKDWLNKIDNADEETIRRFIAFYPSVTSGTPWMIDHEELFIDNLSLITSELKVKGKGLLIVYDEFGRFLQTLEGPNSMRNMQDLQDLAEFVNHTENMQLLVIGHKHIRQYAAYNRESIQIEFEKVEKRFRAYSLETDKATYLRLAGEAAAELNEITLPNAKANESVETLQQYPLFTGYTTHQIEISILRALYPLHPTGAVLLPELSNIFGQNERTLFSFFTDNGSYGMRNHVLKNDGYYYADQLFHFFDVASAETRDQPTLQLYHVVIPFIDDREPLQRRIVELMTLWAVARFTQKQSLTTEFLAFALGVPERVVTSALEQLSGAKVARFNTIRAQWELYDGSSIDVVALVEERAAVTVLSDTRQLELLDRHLPISYILPYEYNDRMDMLRYAEVRFAFPAMLDESQSLLDMSCDDRILLSLFPDKEVMEEVLRDVKHADWTSLVALPTFTMESIKEALSRYHVVEQLLQDSIFLSQDSRLKSELQYLQQETGMSIRSFVQRYFEFGGLKWWSNKQQFTIRDERGLEQRISERLGQKFYLTPSIRNEAFNRNRISSVQKRAMIDVIDRLIRQPNEPNLGITGYGPNYLIYASVLKNNNYVLTPEGAIQCCDSLNGLRTMLVGRLQERPIGRLSDLIEPFRLEPYGIRAAVVPVLFVALLRDVWEQLMFYAHDMLTTHLAGAGIVELIEHADQYEYRYYNLSVEEREQLLALGKQFDLPQEACTGFVQLSEELLRWLRTLPKFALMTEHVSEQTLRVRTAIRSSEVDPYTYLRQLVTMGEAPRAAKVELEEFLAINEMELGYHVSELTGKASMEDLLLELEMLPVERAGLNSRLLTVPVALSEVHDGVIPSAIDRLAEHLVGVSRRDWSDATQKLFLQQFRYEWELLDAGEKSSSSAEIAAALTENLPPIELSKKANVLYANVKNMLKYAGKDVSTAELRSLLAKLMQEI